MVNAANSFSFSLSSPRKSCWHHHEPPSPVSLLQFPLAFALCAKEVANDLNLVSLSVTCSPKLPIGLPHKRRTSSLPAFYFPLQSLRRNKPKEFFLVGEGAECIGFLEAH